MLDILTQDERHAVGRRFAQVPLELQAKFDELYASWELTWNEPLVAASSKPADRARSRQFLDLIALGPTILPLLMHKLMNPDQFFALQAVDHLAGPEITVEFEPEDEIVLKGEQFRAAETIRRWLSLES